MLGMRFRRIAAVAAVLVGASTGLAAQAQADPSAPCGYYSKLPWSPCAEQSPLQKYPGRYDPTGQTPGMMGPGGYVPIQEGR
jgi:hypothetical protein